MTGRVVVGVGNRWRRDDGVGPAVADAVRRVAPAGVAVIEVDGETGRLVEAWAGADVVVVVDAVRTGSPPGTVHRVGDVSVIERRASSHDLGVAAAVALARALDRLPRRLVVIGIEAADVGHGEELSPRVRAAVEPAARLALDLVSEAGACA